MKASRFKMAEKAQQLDTRVLWALERCREVGMRRTRALELALRVLVAENRPLRLDDLATSEVLDGQCDQATVYRLLKRLEENGLIRRLGLHERAAYYVMQFPGEHGDYLICRDCGSIERLQRNCPVEALEKEIAGETGYLDLQHELEFFGTCPACAG